MTSNCRSAFAVFILTAISLLTVVSRAYADTLYYGGDPSQFIPGSYYVAENVINSGIDIEVYDDFTIPVGQTWTITGFFAQIGNPDSRTPVPLAHWDVRTGMTSSSEGTELTSGTSTTATTSTTPLPYNLNHSPSETLTISLPTPLVLSGGQTYWFNLTPIDPNGFNMFVGGTTSHTNGVGGPQDRFAIIDLKSNQGTYYGPSAWNNVDASMGVLGTSSSPATVPEPSSLCLLATGAAWIARIRFRGGNAL